MAETNYLFFRGDTKDLTFKIEKKDHTYVDGSLYDEIELQINRQGQYADIKKLKSTGEITWVTDHFYVLLTQKDTFKVKPGINYVQVRLYKDNKLKGTHISEINVGDTLSKEIIDA